MSDLFVRDVMTPSVVVATPDCRYQQLVDVLTDFDVSGMPVVDEDDRVIGVVSEADVLHPHGRVTAHDLMTSPAVTVAAGARVDEAVGLMERHHLKRLPVVDDDTGHLLGIVTRGDLLRRSLRGDPAIERDIVDNILLHNLWIDSSQVTVQVDGGVVTLGGTIDRQSTAHLLAYLVRGIDGVAAVVNDITPALDDTTGGRQFIVKTDPR